MLACNLGGVTLHARSDGPEGGPVLVLSNSLGTDLRIWDALLPLLPPEVRVIRYDKRGHGLSDCPDGTWGMQDHIADLEGLLDSLGVAGAAICGISVGGLIAQGLAVRRPDLVGRLILCDTAARIGTAESWADRIAAIEQGGIAAMAGAILERWFSAGFRESDPTFPLWRNMLLTSPQAGYLKTCQAIRDSDFTEQTRGLSLPALALCGADDGSTPPDLVRATASLIEGCRFELIEDAGHLPCIEQPAVFATLLTAFLKETGYV